jgi:hypothetical protein
MTVTKFRRRASISFLALIFFAAGMAHGQDADRVSATPPATTREKLARLTETERAREYLKELINPLSFVESAASSAWGQLRDRPHEWGEGGAGYGRRFASSFGQHAVEDTLKFGLANALHEDNRYVASGRRGFGPRLIYALETTLQSRDQDGDRQVSYSKIGSLAGASLLSRLWQPHSTGGAGNGAVNFGISVAFAASLNVAREFMPRGMFLHP